VTTSDAVPDPAAASDATRRSWYLSADAADQLTRAVEELHWEMRVPKHQVLTAIIRAGLGQLDQVRASLGGSSKD
jgi:hypothetical protein